MNGTAELLISGATVITPELAMAGSAVAVSGGKISYLGPEAGAPSSAATVDGSDGFLLPGFIDLHCHGGGGFDSSSGRWDREAKGFAAAPDDFRAGARTIPRTHLAHGTTALLLATCAAGEEQLLAALAAIGEAVGSEETGARVLGVNLEGSYLRDPAYAGAQNPEYFRRPSAEDFDRLNAAAGGQMKLVNVAAEWEYVACDLVRHLISRGVTASCGHTSATYEQMTACMDAGTTLAVHFSNGPLATSFKPPGMATEAMLADPRVTLELIADGHHVNPRYLLSFMAAKGLRGALVTDAMLAVDAPEIARFTISGLTGEKSPDGEVLRLKDAGSTLFGSLLTMDRAVANVAGWLVEGVHGMYQNAPVIDPPPTVEEALVVASRMASGTPAEILDLRREMGAIETGLAADLVLLAADLSVKRVWIGGREIAAREPAAGDVPGP